MLRKLNVTSALLSKALKHDALSWTESSNLALIYQSAEDLDMHSFWEMPHNFQHFVWDCEQWNIAVNKPASGFVLKFIELFMYDLLGNMSFFVSSSSPVLLHR